MTIELREYKSVTDSDKLKCIWETLGQPLKMI